MPEVFLIFCDQAVGKELVPQKSVYQKNGIASYISIRGAGCSRNLRAGGDGIKCIQIRMKRQFIENLMQSGEGPVAVDDLPFQLYDLPGRCV